MKNRFKPFGPPVPSWMVAVWLPLRLLLAGLGGMLVLWLGVWWYQHTGPGRLDSALELTNDRFKLVSGEAEMTREGILFRGLSPGNPIVVLMGLTRLEAENFVRLSWDVNGLMAQQEFAVIWVSSADPQRLHTRVITAEERVRGSMMLKEDTAWRDWILRFGVKLQGELAEPVLFKHITLERPAPTPLTVLKSLAGDWTHHEPWAVSSINFHVGAPSLALLLTPTSLVALWIVCSSLLFVLMGRCSSVPHVAGGLAVLFLFGWFLLDLRWGWQLAARLGQTYERYGRLAPEQRLLAMPDAKLAAAVAQLREVLSSETARIFILSDDPRSRTALRVRYHFLPHRVFLSDRLPNPEKVQEGDYVLALFNQKQIRYDATQQRLISRDGSLGVEPRVKVSGFGDLYRVTGGR